MRHGVVLASLLSASAAVAGEGDWPRVRMATPTAAHTLRRALDGASQRLRSPRCQRLLSEFSDERGRPLRARLDELQTNATSYLPLVVFLDGSERSQCRTNMGLFAYTTRGSRVVFVCGRFERGWYRNPPRAEAVLIHEALHTLGLGEDPPTSVEITRRVQFYCSN
jgi:hypothetical protein